MNNERGHVTADAFFDLQKAVDSVCHTTLLQKLRNCGAGQTSLRWFHSYLTGRQQPVCAGNVMSDYLRATSRVPQQTVFGPLLSSLCMNEMLGPRNGCKIECFADDATVEASGKKAEEAIFHLNKTLDKMNLDLKQLRVPVNTSKTKVIIFVPATQLNESALLHTGHHECCCIGRSHSCETSGNGDRPTSAVDETL